MDLLVVAVQLVALHLGALHPAEKVLTLVLAFGPFVVLAVVIAVRSRRDADGDEEPEPQRPGNRPPEA